MPPKAAAASKDNKEHGNAKDSNEQLNDIQQNIEKILLMLISVEHKVKSVETKVELLNKKMESIVSDVYDQGVHIDSQEKRINTLEKPLENLEDVLDSQENRMRRNNIQILNLPEEEEERQFNGLPGQPDIGGTRSDNNFGGFGAVPHDWYQAEEGQISTHDYHKAMERPDQSQHTKGTR